MSRGDASPLDRIAERERSIEAIADSKPLDVMALRSISRSKGGFTSGRMRRLVWPKLLGINTKSRLEDFKKFISDSKDDIQVSVDIERSLWNYEVTKMWPDKYRDARRKVLSGIITGILCKNKGLHYYQGFHDWVSVILIVLENDNLAFAVADRMSTRFLSDYLKPDFEVVSKMMRILFVILKVADRQLHQFLHDAKMEPFFATSWLLTWFSHDLKSVDEIARIFDALLCSHPLFSFYVCAVYVVSLKKEIMKVECEFAAVYNVLVHAPSQYGFDFENLLPLADDLFRRIPPHKLGPQCDSELTQLIYNKQISCVIADKFPHDPEEDMDEAILDMMGVQEPEKTRFPRLKALGETVLHWGRILTTPSPSKNPLFWPTVAVFGGMVAYFIISSTSPSAATAHYHHSTVNPPLGPKTTVGSYKNWPTQSS